ncbi:MAG: TraB/GumN family protein [bacterium]|nr:TraB/GumN family protein [bacterium]
MSDEPRQESAVAQQDVHRVRLDDRTIILVGTAHVSQESADLVRDVIREEKPDRVCIELDAQRYDALSQKTRWENLDLRQVIRNKQLSTLLVNLLLSSYQKKLGGQLGVMPGTELLEAVRSAEASGVPYDLCDRSIRITLMRAWRSMSLFQKWKLLSALLAGAFGDTEISEDDLRELRSKDVLSEMMEELAHAMPTLKRVLIDERDAYLARKIAEADGSRIVAVVGAGHVEGMVRLLREGHETIDMQEITRIPKTTPVWKWVGWGIPALILGSLGFIAYTKGGQAAGENALFWVVANAVPSGIGAILALGHPLTVLAAFLCAPLTSLTPVIGAGYVTAFVQAYVKPPRVRDFQTISEDALTPSRWWSNLLLRVLLVFILSSLGSVIGTWLGGLKIVSSL